LTISACLLWTQCAKDQIAGNTSETGNPSVVGVLYEPDGKTPAVGVSVIIRPEAYLAVFPGSGAADRMRTIDTAMTDNAGRFTFDSTLDLGVYMVAASSGSNGVMVDSVVIAKKNSTVTLPPQTLNPVGAIKGVIHLAEGGDPAEVYVLAFGIDRFTEVNANGNFLFSSLPSGHYRLRFVATLKNYGTLDTGGVAVASNDTSNLGTIELPSNSIPIPQNVGLSYDTMKQIVMIRWDKYDPAKVMRFKVYRNPVESPTSVIQLNQSYFFDTLYHDSSCAQGETYDYLVAWVDSFNNEGVKSPAVSVKAVEAFVAVSGPLAAGQQFGDIDFVFDNDANFWVADYNANNIYRYGQIGDLLTQWQTSEFLSNHEHPCIGVDLKKNIYLNGMDGMSVQRYDSSGNLLRKAIDSTLVYTMLNICVDGYGNLYSSSIVGNGSLQGTIHRYRQDLCLDKSWKINSNWLEHGLATRNGKVYCAGIKDYGLLPPNPVRDDNVIEIFDSLGVFLTMIHVRLPGETGPLFTDDIAIGKDGLIYCIDDARNRVRIFNETSGYVGKFDIEPGSEGVFYSKIAIRDDGLIAVGTLSNIIFFKHR
jgi:hypothetical protein